MLSFLTEYLHRIYSQFRLPSNGSSLDFRILPYIGNGHIATVVLSDFIYMNGLYNGDNGLSISFLLS